MNLSKLMKNADIAAILVNPATDQFKLHFYYTTYTVIFGKKTKHTKEDYISHKRRLLLFRLMEYYIAC